MTESHSDPMISKPPPPTWYRWSVLVVISLAMFGNYYIYDSISPIVDLLKEQRGFTDENIGFLAAVYNWPNIVMVLIGGIIIDRIGIKKGALIFGALCLIGAAITAASGELKYMASGRLVFGLGAESMIVAVTCAVARWFKGKELAFAFGVNLSIARLGSVAAFNSPTWAAGAYENWQWPLFISIAFGTLCVVGALLYGVMENTGMRRYALGEAGETDKVVFKDIFRFDKSYWLVVLLCVTFYSAIWPFLTFAVDFFQEAHGTTRAVGGSLASMVSLFAALSTPLFGLMVDRVGKRSLFMTWGSMLLVPIYLMMAYTNVPLVVPMAMMGIAFALIPAVMWPSVAYIVDGSKLGTAYGLMTMVQNIGWGGLNYLIGWANTTSDAGRDNPDGYALGMWIFTVLGVLAVVFAWMLRRHETGPNAHGLETITVKSSA